LNSTTGAGIIRSGRIKTGIIGCGKAAEIIYVRALKAIPEMQVTAVCDPVKERRELLSNCFGSCLTFESPGAGFIEQVDAALILTPPKSHIAIAVELLKAGKYVLVEKPLALSSAGIKELKDTEAASKAFLMMGFNLRYWTPVVHLKNKIACGIKTDSAEFDFTSNYAKWNPVSFISDPLDDLGPHVFDLVPFIFNKEIFSVKIIEQREKELRLEIKMSDGKLINCRLAHSDSPGRTIKLKSPKENFLLTVDSVRISPVNGRMRKILNVYDLFKRKLLKEPSPVKNTFEQQLKKFLDFINSGQKAVPGIKEGIDAVKAAEAARKSSGENGKEIYLNEIS
jgi:myo-inositol 2-dehydrogenase/D-chiro-inositol 1-dehydrogenase